MINRKLGILSKVGLGNAKDEFKDMPTTLIESPSGKNSVNATGESRKRTLDDYFEKMAEDDDEILKRVKLSEWGKFLCPISILLLTFPYCILISKSGIEFASWIEQRINFMSFAWNLMNFHSEIFKDFRSWQAIPKDLPS